MAISFEYGLNVPAKEYDGKNKYLRITDINEDSHEFVMENVTSPNVDLSIASQYKLSEGDILFARTGASVGKTYIYKVSDGRVYYAGFLIRARIRGEINAEFVYQNTLTDNYNKYITITSQRSGQPGVNAQEYAKYEILIPDREEQDKISAYLRSIDKLITFHHRKLNILNKICRYAWEQRKLPEFVSFFNGLTYTPDDVEETGTLVLRSSNVKNGEIVDADNVYVNGKVVTSENVQEGDIIVVVRNGSRALIGKHAQIKASMPNTVIGAFMSGMRSEHSSFVNALLDTSAFENEIAKNMGATINQITGYMFSKMEFMIPSGEEQQQIGEYFQRLDHLITLHQRKCDEAKKLKKCMLQKMFPKDGEKVPEIRFSGFTGDWKQRKLGDVFKEYSEKNHAEQPALTIMQGEGTIKREDSERNLLYNKSNLSSYKMVYQDDFIVHLRSFEGGLEKASCNGIVSPAYHIFHGEKADSRFYYSYFRSYEFIKRKLVPHIYGIRDGRSIDIAGMKTIDIPYPSFEEQQRIGDYLDSVNNLITFHQRKCDELKNIKKFMLQNMFVSEK